DEQFRGTIICSVAPFILFRVDREAPRQMLEFLDYYKRVTPSDIISQHLAMPIQKTFAFRLPELAPGYLSHRLRYREFPEPSFYLFHRNRFRSANYKKTDAEKQKKKRLFELADQTPIKDEGEIRAIVAHVADLVKRIEARGGKVIFVVLPISGEARDLEQGKFPRRRYWDVFAAGVGAPAIHFEDHEALRGFECPDGSHLDGRDSDRFTRALVSVLLIQDLI
ncbi:hypothetical protein ACFLU6_16055, partial [Acidobacteriota bacterium]